MIIAVIGDGQCTDEVSAIAEEVGRELAGRGATIVCGGLGGVMEAACKGAKSAGGTTIGILPGRSRRDANKYVDIPIVTGMGEARNVIVVKSAQAVIAIGGRFGTLSEIALALRDQIPVIGINTWSLTREGQIDSSIIPADNPRDAAELAISLAAN